MSSQNILRHQYAGCLAHALANPDTTRGAMGPDPSVDGQGVFWTLDIDY